MIVSGDLAKDYYLVTDHLKNTIFFLGSQINKTSPVIHFSVLSPYEQDYYR